MLENIRYIDVVDVAKLVRQALKLAYPATKFRVRSSRHGTDRCGGWGASVYVIWFVGPTQGEVRGLVQQYEGSRFDGIGDPLIPVSHWLRADGTTLIRHARHVSPDQPEIDNRHPVFQSTEGVEAVQFKADIILTHKEPDGMPEPLTFEQRYGDRLPF